MVVLTSQTWQNVDINVSRQTGPGTTISIVQQALVCTSFEINIFKTLFSSTNLTAPAFLVLNLAVYEIQFLDY